MDLRLGLLFDTLAQRSPEDGLCSLQNATSVVQS